MTFVNVSMIYRCVRLYIHVLLRPSQNILVKSRIFLNFVQIYSRYESCNDFHYKIPYKVVFIKPSFSKVIIQYNKRQNII